MKIPVLLSVCLFAIIYKSLSQDLRFYGLVQTVQNGKIKPVSKAKISVIGSNLSYENVLLSDSKGLFLITFKQGSANKDFRIHIEHKDYEIFEETEIVTRTIEPKKYTLILRNNEYLKHPNYAPKTKAVGSKGKTSITNSTKLNSLTPLVHINSSKSELNVSKGDLWGLAIHMNFDIDYAKNKRCLACLEFFDMTGKPLNDKDSLLSYDNGKVGKEEEFVPNYTNCNYEDFEFYFPYSVFESINNKHKSKYKLLIYTWNSKENVWDFVYDSSYYILEFEDD
jgi:hypothetical protein